jgi:hypothetical protein
VIEVVAHAGHWAVSLAVYGLPVAAVLGWLWFASRRDLDDDGDGEDGSAAAGPESPSESP